MVHNKNHLNNNLRKQRRLMGYKLREVARILDINNTSRISKWELGTSTPSLKNLVKLSIIYRTLMDQFYLEYRDKIKKEINHSISKYHKKDHRARWKISSDFRISFKGCFFFVLKQNNHLWLLLWITLAFLKRKRQRTLTFDIFILNKYVEDQNATLRPLQLLNNRSMAA